MSNISVIERKESPNQELIDALTSLIDRVRKTEDLKMKCVVILSESIDNDETNKFTTSRINIPSNIEYLGILEFAKMSTFVQHSE